MISWTTGASEASPQARAEGPSVHASYNRDLLFVIYYLLFIIVFENLVCQVL